MKKLDWYILKKFLGTFFYAILILAVIIAVIDYSEKVDEFVKRRAPLTLILNYYKNFLPQMIAFLFPLFIFIATIFFTSKLANQSEIIAILASGVSFPRFLRPYLIGALLLCGFSYLANNYIIPRTNKELLVFKNKYIDNLSTSSGRNVHLRLSENLYVYMQNYDFISNTGYRFTSETIQKNLLKEKIMAERVSYDSVKKLWNLYSVTIRENDGMKEKLTTVPQLSRSYPSFSPKDLVVDNQVMTAMTTPVLDQVIAREKLRGRENLNEYYVEKHIRTAQPFAALILTIIGACIACRKIRGGSGIHLAFGVVLSAAYMMALQFSKTFSTKAGLNPLVAVWIPNMIFGAVAYYYYRKQVK
ncbi:MAG TPA: LptF/LptG family permease [Flavipsychrobacter sp.]|nr:LptF/LptG family permease [Flavipsychrobacter sp.]